MLPSLDAANPETASKAGPMFLRTRLETLSGMQVTR